MNSFNVIVYICWCVFWFKTHTCWSQDGINNTEKTTRKYSQIVNCVSLARHSKDSTSNLTSRGQYRGSVTCPCGLRWAFWTWREVIGWIHWRSNWCFDLIAAYKIPMWLLNKGREKASGIVRYSHEAQIHTSESTFSKCKKYCHDCLKTWITEIHGWNLLQCMHTDTTLCLPANDEMRHGDQEGPKRHQDTSDCYDLGSVELGTKIAHKGNNQQVPYMVEMIRKGDGDESEALNMRSTERISISIV